MTSLIDATMRKKWGLTILSQGATLLRANHSNQDASGQNGLSPFFAPSSTSRLRETLGMAGK
jgi:hypothetical protein